MWWVHVNPTWATVSSLYGGSIHQVSLHLMLSVSPQQQFFSHKFNPAWARVSYFTVVQYDRDRSKWRYVYYSFARLQLGLSILSLRQPAPPIKLCPSFWLDQLTVWSLVSSLIEDGCCCYWCREQQRPRKHVVCKSQLLTLMLTLATQHADTQHERWVSALTQCLKQRTNYFNISYYFMMHKFLLYIMSSNKNRCL